MILLFSKAFINARLIFYSFSYSSLLSDFSPILFELIPSNKTIRSSDPPVSLQKVISVNSLVSPSDYWSIWSFVAISSYTGLKLEENTKIGRSLSSPVCAMLVSAFLTNLNILPSEGSIYITNLQTFIVKYATPMLLLGADIQRISRESGSLVKSFFLGTIGTCLGSFLSFCIFKSWFESLGILGEGWKMVSAITAKNIGGGLNFMAVSNILELSSQSISIALTVDNIMGLVYFPFISFLASRYNADRIDKKSDPSFTEITSSSQAIPTVSSLLSTVTIGLVLVAASEKLATLFPIPSLLLSTIITIVFASTILSSRLTISSTSLQSLFPSALQKETIINTGELIGKLFLLLFFGSIGNSSGKISQIFISPMIVPLLLFVFSLYSIHLLFLFLVGKQIFQLETSDLLLGSNANIGNAATACTLATAMNWKEKLIPAILIGNLGNIIGTFLGLGLGVYILKPLS